VGVALSWPGRLPPGGKLSGCPLSDIPRHLHRQTTSVGILRGGQLLYASTSLASYYGYRVLVDLDTATGECKLCSGGKERGWGGVNDLSGVGARAKGWYFAETQQLSKRCWASIFRGGRAGGKAVVPLACARVTSACELAVALHRDRLLSPD
jgi:hypothetical protein